MARNYTIKTGGAAPTFPKPTKPRGGALMSGNERPTTELTRALTHKLSYVGGRWSCKCGYILGAGHKKLYASCPLAGKPETTHREIGVTGKGKRDKQPPTKSMQNLFRLE